MFDTAIYHKNFSLSTENGSPLSIKASGGVKTYAIAAAMIHLGVRRIGTNSVHDHHVNGVLLAD